MMKKALKAAAAALLLAFGAGALSLAASAQTDSAAETPDSELGETISPEEFQKRFDKAQLDRAFGLSDMMILPAKLTVAIGRGESLYVRNRSSHARDFRIVATDLGDDEDYENARDFARYGPRQFTLAPEETQIVRIFARRPPDGEKEYRLRLSVRLLPVARVLPEVAEGEIRTQFSAIYAVSIPVDFN